MNTRLNTMYTDFTQVKVGGKLFLRIGTPIEFAAMIKAGFIVNSNIRPVKGNPPSQSLNILVPHIGRFVAMLRDEQLHSDLTVDDYVEYVNNHANYFQSRRTATTTR